LHLGCAIPISLCDYCGSLRAVPVLPFFFVLAVFVSVKGFCFCRRVRWFQSWFCFVAGFRPDLIFPSSCSCFHFLRCLRSIFICSSLRIVFFFGLIVFASSYPACDLSSRTSSPWSKSIFFLSALLFGLRAPLSWCGFTLSCSIWSLRSASVVSPI
jgi:hypothetical protein